MATGMDSLGCTHLAQKPCDQITKYNGFVGFRVAGWRGDASCSPQVAFPFIEPAVAGSSVDEKNPRSALNQPSSIHELDATFLHRGDCVAQWTRRRLEDLDFDSRLLMSTWRFQQVGRVSGYRVLVEGPNKGIAIAIFSSGDGGF